MLRGFCAFALGIFWVGLAYADGPPPTPPQQGPVEAIEHTVRSESQALLAVQQMLLQIPDLVSQNQKLTARVKELEDQLKAATPQKK